MAQVRSAILCDFAQVREGLVFISSGGITRIAAPQPGSPVQFFAACDLEVLPFEIGEAHTLTFKVVNATTAKVAWEANLQVNTMANPDGLFPGESLHVPIAFRVGPFPVEAFGPHDLKVSIDNYETELLTFYVLQMVQPPGQAAEDQSPNE